MSPRGLETARHMLQSRTAQPALALPGVRYLDPREVDPEDQVLIHFDKQWQALFEEARLRVLKRVIDAGLVIESCPTSNRVVAGLTTAPIEVFLDEKKLYGGQRRKNQPDPVLPKVVLATDDPGIFDAWPSVELEVVNSGQRHLLYQAAEAATWIRTV